MSFVASIVVVLMEWTCTERGVVYEFELSARNDVDFGDVAVQTIRTPDGSQYLFPLYNFCLRTVLPVRPPPAV